MDLSDITKVASRKRMNADAEKLREKVSRETAKIIKIKVAQDTAYWELQEKLATLGRDHERLQRNMVEVQMQHEAASAQYHAELRLRPETLNKLAGTREICDVLEENVSRVRATLQRCAADRTALCDAYSRAAAAVDTARADHARRAAAAALAARSLQDRLKLCAEHNMQLAECVASTRRQGEAAAGAAQAQLAAAAEDAAHLRAMQAALQAQLAARDSRLEETEKTIAELREELKRVLTEFSAQSERTGNKISELQREAGAAETLREALAAAQAHNEAAARDAAQLQAELAAARDSLHHHRQETQANAEELKQELKSVIEKNKELLIEINDKDENIRSLEVRENILRSESSARADELWRVIAERDEARAAAEKAEAGAVAVTAELNTMRSELKARANEVAQLADDLRCMTAQRDEALAAAENAAAIAKTAAEATSDLATELEEARCSIVERSTEVTRLEDELKRAVTERDEARAETEQVKAIAAERTAERDEARAAAERAANAAEERTAERDEARRELKARIEASAAAEAKAESELAERADTIARLMRDVAAEAEARARSHAALGGARADLAAAREQRERAEDNVRRLDAAVREKEKEAAEQMKIILEIRGEKERLQERIRGMENTIENVQKELRRDTAAPTAPARDPPEHDDNAMPAPPHSLRQGTFVKPAKAEFAVPPPRRDQRQLDRGDLLYSFLSDNSMDGDMLDPEETNRRFEALSRARGEALPPLHSLVKRNRAFEQARVEKPVAHKQARAAPGARARSFFKNRRANDAEDARLKKQK